MSASETGNGNRWISTELRGFERKRLIAYMALVAGIGLVFAVLEVRHYDLPDPCTTAFFTILGMISLSRPIKLAARLNLHATWPILIAALYCYGLPLALLTGVPGMLAQAVFLRKPWLTSMFNAGQMAISLGLADLAFQQVRCVTPHTITCKIVALVLAMVVFDLCNVTLVSIAVARERKQEWQECFWQMAIARRRSLCRSCTSCPLQAPCFAPLSERARYSSVSPIWLQCFTSCASNGNWISGLRNPARILTKAKNYRYLEDWLHSEFPKLVAGKTPCSFVFIDLDGLKTVNDSSATRPGIRC